MIKNSLHQSNFYLSKKSSCQSNFYFSLLAVNHSFVDNYLSVNRLSPKYFLLNPYTHKHTYPVTHKHNQGHLSLKITGAALFSLTDLSWAGCCRNACWRNDRFLHAFDTAPEALAPDLTDWSLVTVSAGCKDARKATGHSAYRSLSDRE